MRKPLAALLTVAAVLLGIAVGVIVYLWRSRVVFSKKATGGGRAVQPPPQNGICTQDQLNAGVQAAISAGAQGAAAAGGAPPSAGGGGTPQQSAGQLGSFLASPCGAEIEKRLRDMLANGDRRAEAALMAIDRARRKAQDYVTLGPQRREVAHQIDHATKQAGSAVKSAAKKLGIG